MTHFSYRGRNRSGVLVNGTLEAASASAVADRLADDGVIPLAIDEIKTKAAGETWNWRQRKPDLSDLIMFSRQMYTLTRAGVPILRAFAGLAESSSNPLFARQLREIGEALASGQDLASALAVHEETFNSFYVAMIHVGENTGRLDEAFQQLARNLEFELHTRKRISSALRYPTFVVIAISIAIAVINVKVIPAFSKLFASFKTELPLPTRILIGISDVFVNYWWLILLVLAGAAFAWLRFIATDEGRLWWDERKLKLPLIGDLIYRALLGRFSRSFATMSRAGVTLTTALSVVARVVDNRFVGQKILSMREGMEHGESITQNAANTGMFSPLVLQMLAVGEETGALDELLDEVAGFYEREVDYDLERLSERIEPIMIVAVGALVLILALGVFLPMWDLTKLAHVGA